MDEECCWSIECGRGRGCEAPKVTDIGGVKCGNEGITTPEAPLDDDGYSDKISSILSTLHVKFKLSTSLTVLVLTHLMS